MGLKLFKCFIEENGWGTYYERNPEIIIAQNAEEASTLYRSNKNLRKNAKGLKIKEVPYKVGKRINKQKLEKVLMEEIYPIKQAYKTTKEVTHFYCNCCMKEVNRYDSFCKGCGTYFPN